MKAQHKNSVFEYKEEVSRCQTVGVKHVHRQCMATQQLCFYDSTNESNYALYFDLFHSVNTKSKHDVSHYNNYGKRPPERKQPM